MREWGRVACRGVVLTRDAPAPRAVLPVRAEQSTPPCRQILLQNRIYECFVNSPGSEPAHTGLNCKGKLANLAFPQVVRTAAYEAGFARARDTSDRPRVRLPRPDRIRASRAPPPILHYDFVLGAQNGAVNFGRQDVGAPRGHRVPSCSRRIRWCHNVDL